MGVTVRGNTAKAHCKHINSSCPQEPKAEAAPPPPQTQQVQTHPHTHARACIQTHKRTYLHNHAKAHTNMQALPKQGPCAASLDPHTPATISRTHKHHTLEPQQLVALNLIMTKTAGSKQTASPVHSGSSRRCSQNIQHRHQTHSGLMKLSIRLLP
jgi:hypothetical protein